MNEILDGEKSLVYLNIQFHHFHHSYVCLFFSGSGVSAAVFYRHQLERRTVEMSDPQTANKQQYEQLKSFQQISAQVIQGMKAFKAI